MHLAITLYANMVLFEQCLLQATDQNKFIDKQNDENLIFVIATA